MTTLSVVSHPWPSPRVVDYFWVAMMISTVMSGMSLNKNEQVRVGGENGMLA